MVASIVNYGARALLLIVTATLGVAQAGGGGGSGGDVIGPSPQCLLNKPDKVCLYVDTMTTSGAPGREITLTASFQSVLQNNSSRNADLTMTLSPSTGYYDLVADPELACQLLPAGGDPKTTVYCTTDKLSTSTSVVRKVTVKLRAPDSGSIVNTAKFGWGGRNGTVLSTMTTSVPAGYGYYPAGDNSLQTKPVKAVSKNDPVWSAASMTLAHGALCRIDIVTNGPTDYGSSCTAGIINTSGGQAVLCHDNESILGDAGGGLIGGGVGRRFIKLDCQTEDTVIYEITLLDHSSIESPVQALLPLFPYPFFYAGISDSGFTATKTAFNTCATNPALPCIISAVQNSDLSWEVHVRVSNDTPYLASMTPVDHLYALMNFVVKVAGASTIKPPVLYK